MQDDETPIMQSEPEAPFVNPWGAFDQTAAALWSLCE